MAVDTYEVGYCRPPKQHQFKKGQSGNPKGRPKDSKNFATILEKYLDAKTRVKIGDKVTNVSFFEAIVLGFLKRAMSGDVKVLQRLTELLPERFGDEAMQVASEEEVKAYLLERLLGPEGQ